MKRLRKFLLLPAAERGLLLRAALLLGAIRLGLWLLPFRAVRRLVTRASRSHKWHKDDGLSSDRIAWAVETASRYLPGTKNCLVQALTAHVLLARRGRPTSLRIGVARGQRGQLEAHAWVESQGRIVIGGTGAGRFVPFPAFKGEGP